jgi:hypothetical protein
VNNNNKPANTNKTNSGNARGGKTAGVRGGRGGRGGATNTNSNNAQNRNATNYTVRGGRGGSMRIQSGRTPTQPNNRGAYCILLFFVICYFLQDLFFRFSSASSYPTECDDYPCEVFSLGSSRRRIRLCPQDRQPAEEEYACFILF